MAITPPTAEAAKAPATAEAAATVAVEALKEGETHMGNEHGRHGDETLHVLQAVGGVERSLGAVGQRLGDAVCSTTHVVGDSARSVLQEVGASTRLLQKDVTDAQALVLKEVGATTRLLQKDVTDCGSFTVLSLSRTSMRLSTRVVMVLHQNEVDGLMQKRAQLVTKHRKLAHFRLVRRPLGVQLDRSSLQQTEPLFVVPTPNLIPNPLFLSRVDPHDDELGADELSPADLHGWHERPSVRLTECLERSNEGRVIRGKLGLAGGLALEPRRERGVWGRGRGLCLGRGSGGPGRHGSGSDDFAGRVNRESGRQKRGQRERDLVGGREPDLPIDPGDPELLGRCGDFDAGRNGGGLDDVGRRLRQPNDAGECRTRGLRAVVRELDEHGLPVAGRERLCAGFGFHDLAKRQLSHPATRLICINSPCTHANTPYSRRASVTCFSFRAN